MAFRWWPRTMRELLWERGESWLADRVQALMPRVCARFGHVWGYRGRFSFGDATRDGHEVRFDAAGRGCRRCLWFHVWTWSRVNITRRDAELRVYRSMTWPTPGTYWLRTHDGPPSDAGGHAHEAQQTAAA